MQVADAVAYAHGRGVVHRDLKPSNIILDDLGYPNLADFGIARELRDAVRLTAASEMVGSFDYIAPEILSGEEGGAASDVYGLAMTAYECLHGRPAPHSCACF